MNTAFPTLLLVDSRVEDYQSLLDGVYPETEAIILNEQDDGLEQITQLLQKRTHLQSVHLITHGSPGCLYIGNSHLDLHGLKQYETQLKSWSKAFKSNNSVLMIYGCQVAATEAGAEFIAKLEQITGLTIAASATRTGNKALGGNWELEVTTGEINVPLAFNARVREAYQGVLATFEVTNTNDSGAGSLRQAIEDANLNVGADRIIFAGEVFSDLNPDTITLTSGQLQISDDLVIEGLGADQLTVSGNNSSRVFLIQDQNYDNNINVEIQGLTITGGNTSIFDGAILNGENLTVTNSTVSDNQGIGIFNFGEKLTVTNSFISGNEETGIRFSSVSSYATLTVTNSTISGNGGSGIVNDTYNEGATVSNSIISGNQGSGIYNVYRGSTTVIDSIISENQESGIYNDYGGSITVIDSIISENQATRGGGINNNFGFIRVINSTISNNQATTIGGGILNIARGIINVFNSTISGNRANIGGGVYNFFGEVFISSSTITSNQTSSGDGSGIATRGNLFETKTVVTNTIVAANIDDDVSTTGGSGQNNFISGGYNLIGTGDATRAFSNEGDQTGITDPGLEPLADNGGATLTHALQPDSPAINAGNDALLPLDTEDLDGDGNTTEPLPIDQRGVIRVQGGNLDIGAVEFDFTSVPFSVVSLILQKDLVIEGAQQGMYRLSRIGNLDNPLTVQLNATGSLGLTPDDFNLIGATGTFPNFTATIGAGESFVDLRLAAVDDSVIEPDETVTLNLVADDAYEIDEVLNSGTVTILDSSGIFTVTNTNNSGLGSLRQAILNANAFAGINTINFDPSLSGQKINLTSSLNIFDDLIIDGLGEELLSISGNNNSVVFYIDGNVDVDIEGVTITEGNNPSGFGGGIINGGNLTLRNSTISGNTAGAGGGISNRGSKIFDYYSYSYKYYRSSLTLIDSTISGNTSTSRGGGIFNYVSNVTVSNSTISDNTANSGSGGGGFYSGGGGVFNISTNLEIINSTISNNQAEETGGGINNLSGNLIVTNSTISGNKAETGGGINNFEGNLTLINSTVTLNQAQPGRGSGIASRGETAYSYNYSYTTTTQVGNSIISGNLNSDVDFISNDINTFSSLGHNLIGTGNAIENFNQQGDIIGITDPGLEPLADNGGSTLTHALKPDSPAINAGSNDLLPLDITDLDNDSNTSEPLPVDQRGQPRIIGSSVDIGAVESEFVSVPPPTVSIIAVTDVAPEGGDDGVYRLFRSGNLDSPLIVQLNAIGSPTLIPDEFNLSGVTGTFPNFTVTFGAGESFVDLRLSVPDDLIPEVDETLTLNLVADEVYRIDQNSSSATVTIEDLIFYEVTNTNDSGAGSLRQAILDANASDRANRIIFNESLSGQTIRLTSGRLKISDDLIIDGLGADKLTISGNNNSSVFYLYDENRNNQTKVTISGLTITEGNYNSGGGILNFGETLTVTDSIISGNIGGGIHNSGYFYGEIQTKGNLTLINSMVSNNTGFIDGGGLYNRGNLTLINSTVSNNTTERSGGGIFNRGNLTITNSTISGNTAGSGGGGIYNGDNMTVINSTISGNTASTRGGGISNFGSMTVTNSTITLNQAQLGGGSGIANSRFSGTVTEVGNSIISGNLNSDVNSYGSFYGGTAFISNGYNLIGTGNVLDSFNQEGDITGITDPGLEPLANNGGPTLTHALKPNSRAINAGSNSLIPPDTLDLDGDGDVSEPLPVDQRGQPRIIGDRVDIGAFEAPPILPKVVLGTSSDDIFDAAAPDSKLFVGDNQTLFTAKGDDIVNVSAAIGGNRVDTGSGDDIIHVGTNNRIFAGSGDDVIFAGSGGGNNVITGGAGDDIFWGITDESTFPLEVNVITDFTQEKDLIAFALPDLSFENLMILQSAKDTLIQVDNQNIFKLLNIQSNSLEASDFIFAAPPI